MPISRNNPTAYLTLGDPAGIGPEVVLKALQSPHLGSLRTVVIGSGNVLSRVERLTRFSIPKKALFVDLKNVPEKGFRYGKVSAIYGMAAFEFIKEGVQRVGRDPFGFLVTAPIHKEALQKAGLPWPGHTEMLQDLTGAKRINMMFVGKRLRISLVTWHVSIRSLPNALTSSGVWDALFLMEQALRRYFSIPRPMIGLCALNPHAGEGGIFGDEERRILKPALQRARRKGIRVEGPLPSDDLFYRAYHGRYDGVVALYHDQGLIPFKMIEREVGVNVSLGLPFVRTSPDHGTAFDIAGKDRADPRSMIEAIRLGRAMTMADSGKRHGPWNS